MTMATVRQKLMTADEFYKWASHAPNQDRLFELDEGRVVEVPPPSEFHAVLCALISHLLWNYVLQRGKGHVCSNDTGLLISRKPGTVRGPDIMLFDDGRPLDKLSRRFADKVPKLVVEVLSPTDNLAKINRRISQFLRRGVSLVWLVDAETRSVTVYRPGQELQIVQQEGELTGEDVLPKLRLRVKELFALPGQS
jgi:Uma2 family endonuclease